MPNIEITNLDFGADKLATSSESCEKANNAGRALQIINTHEIAHESTHENTHENTRDVAADLDR